MDTLALKPNAVKKANSKKTFLLMLAAFALPVILAKLALELQWLNYGVTNKGQLLAQPINLKELGLDDAQMKKHWLIVFSLPNQCNKHCKQTLQTVFNTYIALGKDKPRVMPVALSQSTLTANKQKQLTAQNWYFIEATLQSKQLFSEPQVLIVDPLGNLVMSHTLPNEQAKLAFFGKQILADMKKLLKYSKVG